MNEALSIYFDKFWIKLDIVNDRINSPRKPPKQNIILQYFKRNFKNI